MRKEDEIPIGAIVMDRYPLNESTLRLIFYLMSGGQVPPIKVSTLGNGQFRIKDGRHRVTAFKLLGRQWIRAKYSTKPLKTNCVSMLKAERIDATKIDFANLHKFK